MLKKGVICFAELSASNWNYNKSGLNVEIRYVDIRAKKSNLEKFAVRFSLCISEAQICLGLNMVTLFALFY